MIDYKIVEYIAKLARLELTETEKKLYAQELNSIVEYMRQLESIDSEINKSVKITDFSQTPLREDLEENSLSIEELTRNAPEIKKDFFVIPRVLG